MRRHMSIPMAASAMLALGLSCSAAGAFEYRQIDGWAVSCNNAYVCTISLNPPAGEGQSTELAAIQWHRDAAPSAPLTLSLPYPPGFYQQGDSKGVFQIGVDGSPVFRYR
nr:hypothetical protein [Marinicella sp. W31]MDC2876258.1 hypothetical protein [Marinicella sp. W31]